MTKPATTEVVVLKAHFLHYPGQVQAHVRAGERRTLPAEVAADLIEKGVVMSTRPLPRRRAKAALPSVTGGDLADWIGT